MYKMFGPTALTWCTTDSSRMYMFTAHIKQTLTLLEPDVPRLATGMENSFGKYSHGYKRLEGTWEVVAIIPKFQFPDYVEDQKHTQIYTIVLYNKKTDTYDMIEKQAAENLSEKFGYVYNTSFMDSLQVGQKISNAVLYKSTSYDKHMNYRYGKNARVYFSTSTDTIEDAIVIRRGWAQGVKSVEIDSVSVPINDNDVLLNIYGDGKTYLTFPEVGQEVRDSLICATRRINKAHILYDFQQQNMREVMDTDNDYYVSKHSVVYDINVYYNGEEPFPQTLFYSQLYRYYRDGCEYADAVLNWCNKIKKSGSKYTKNVTYYRAKYLRWNDPAYKWVNKDRSFSNIILEFKVRTVVDLDHGSKLTGRFGNKGVISRIVEDPTNTFEDSVIDLVDDGTLTPDDRALLKSKISLVDDERMPYYIGPDGSRVYADIICNASGGIRRLNPGQLVEVETNFQAEGVQWLIKQAKTMEEKLDIFFRFLDCVSPDQETFFKTMYDSYDQRKNINGMRVHMMSPESQAAFIADVEKNGFYIVRPPHKPLLYDDVIRVYQEFPEIKPQQLYVDLFGLRQKKMMRPGVIGYMYMLVLKQNTNKNFNARSTFRVNRSNLPAKDIAKKTNRCSYARTPVRLSEIYNLLCAVNATDLAEFNIFTRSSALGRKSLDRIISASGNPLKIVKLKVQDNFTNANADILAAKMKTLGIRLRFSSSPDGMKELYLDSVQIALHFGPYTIYDYPSTRKMYHYLFEAFNKHMNDFRMVEMYRGEKSDYCWDLVFDDPEIKKEWGDKITDDLINDLKLLTKGRITQDLEALSRESKKKVASKTTKPDGVTTQRKRGRKSKAEKLALEKERELFRSINRHDHDSDEDEEEDSDEFSADESDEEDSED